MTDELLARLAQAERERDQARDALRGIAERCESWDTKASDWTLATIGERAREVSTISTTDARIPCYACGQWIYTQRRATGGPSVFPPKCQVCGAPLSTNTGARELESARACNAARDALQEIAALRQEWEAEGETDFVRGFWIAITTAEAALAGEQT